MKIIATRDRIELSHEEIQSILVDHIIKVADRIPDGGVNIQSEATQTGTKHTAYAHLKGRT